MSLIHYDAFQGKLNATALLGYLNADPGALTSLDTCDGGPKIALSPLALAVFAGRLDVVTLLLAKDSPFPVEIELGSERYSPLFYAITRAPPNSRITLVNALLDAGANIKSCSKDEDDFTPLMFAISRTQDPELIHALVDRGADLDIKEERNGTTAELLAKQVGLEKELLPKDKRQSSQGELMYYFFAVAMVVYMYAKTAFGGLLKDMLAIPQVKSALKVATDKFNADVSSAIKDLGQKLEKGSTKILETQKQVNGSSAKKSSSKTKAPRSKTLSTSGGLSVPTIITPSASTASTPAFKTFPLPN